MKIEHLELSGMRSHRGNPPTVLDLEGNQLVAIVGPTGAGKSSLLEAVCFALFGEATFGGRAYKDLATDGTSEINVRMRFTVGPERYELVRVVAPNRKGAFGAKETWLRQIDTDGNPLMATHTDQVRKVDARIRSLLGGMDREQFCQAVLLAQNRFAELLEADERKRNELLDILLRLTALEQARRAIQLTQKSAQRNLVRLQDKRDNLPPDPRAALKQARARRKAFEALAESAKTTSTTLEQLVARAGAIAGEVLELERALGLRVAGEDGREVIERTAGELAELASRDVRLEEAIKTAEKAVASRETLAAASQASLESIEAARGSAGTHDVVTAHLGSLRDLLSRKPQQVRELASRMAELVEVDRERTAAEAALVATTGAAQARKDEEDAAQVSVAQLRGELDQRTALVASVSERADRLLRTRSSLQMVDELSVTDQALSLAREELEAANAGHESAVAGLDSAQRAAAAAAAAHGCQPGDECPVCTQVLPPSWSPPEDAGVTEAQSAASTARQAASAAANALKGVESDWSRQLGSLLAAFTSFEEEREFLSAACRENGMSGPPATEPVRLAANASMEVVRQAAAVVENAIAEVSAWKAELEGLPIPLRSKVQDAESDAASATERRAGADLELRGAQDRAKDLSASKVRLEDQRDAISSALAFIEEQVADLVGRLPDRTQLLVDLDNEDPVRQAIHATTEDKNAVEAALYERTSTSEALQEQHKQLGLLREEKVRAVEAPRAVSAHTLQSIWAAVRQLGDLVDLPAPEEVDVGAPPEELLECANQLQGAEALASTAATRKVEELQAMATELAAPADAALQELIALKEKADPGGAKIAVSLDATSPLDPETVGSVQQLRGAALAGRAEADGEVQRAEGDRSLVAELDRRIAALTNWSADLAGAVEILKKDQFPAWARDQRITELVQSSSDLLSQMTGGRYRFDPHLRISDEIAGVVRSASTLSGGEKFEAALALALGVAEIAGRSGIRFDTLFLDEGFAGLDQANLDRALDALETEVEAGRCIVLITHIGAVADRIKDVLLVESDGSGGSKTRWLNEEERFELGADLDLVSIGDA